MKTIVIPPVAVFDLDGTLVDSLADIAAPLNRLMAARGLAPFDAAEVAAMVGDGARALVAKALAARGAAFDEAAAAAYLADYVAPPHLASRPFDGIPEALDALAAAGWRLAICTNKPLAPARALLAALGLAPRFAAILGGDSLPVRKPDPTHLLATLAAAGGEVAHSVMLGDHHNDMAVATGAGTAAVFCAWGYGARSMAGGAPVAETPAALPALLAGLRRGGG